MKRRQIVFSILAAIGGLLVMAAEIHGAPATAKMCQGCHGQDGISMAQNVPSIAGISVVVHEDYLYAYKDGTRTCSDAKTKAMCASTSRLTEEQIGELAEYFAVMPHRAVEQAFDAEKAAAGGAIHEAQCSKCHSENGGNPDDDASILAGQPLAYLIQSMKQFYAGEREQSAAMQRKMTELSEADIEALAHFYASQQ